MGKIEFTAPFFPHESLLQRKNFLTPRHGVGGGGGGGEAGLVEGETELK